MALIGIHMDQSSLGPIRKKSTCNLMWGMMVWNYCILQPHRERKFASSVTWNPIATLWSSNGMSVTLLTFSLFINGIWSVIVGLETAYAWKKLSCAGFSEPWMEKLGKREYHFRNWHISLSRLHFSFQMKHFLVKHFVLQQWRSNGNFFKIFMTSILLRTLKLHLWLAESVPKFSRWKVFRPHYSLKLCSMCMFSHLSNG